MRDHKFRQDIQSRLKSAGDWTFSRGRHDHPCFASAPRAAEHLLALLPPGAGILVMRDACLRPLRELILRRGDSLLTTDKAGQQAVSIPPSALGSEPGAVLRVHPLPKGSELYTGSVDAVVVACLAYSIGQPRLFGFDTDRTAQTLEDLAEGTSPGFRLTPDTPVICLASDAQEVSGWPSEALGYVRCDLVVTATRVIDAADGTVIDMTIQEA